ncbi:MAG: trypsin-like peptidase domain-containing protein [Luteolibacter sp.]
MKPLISFLFSSVFFLNLNCLGEESDAREIFEVLEPSLVAITNAEGGGSGIVLTESGLIITNFHVANTPLPLSVEVMVSAGGKPVKKTFEGVKLLKVHKTSDLALLQVETGGARLKPAKISKSSSDTVAGGTCYALGYPYVPGQEKPTLTITKGIVNSANRIVDGNPYIQLDAAINPGNSGGALANDKGVVIGIPTMKFEGADRIGLAAPLADLRMDQFVEVEKRKGNPEEAARLSDMATTLVFRDAFSFGTDPYAVEIAIFLQREAISLDPNNAQWSLNIASMYLRLRMNEIALAYAKSSVEKDPENLYSRSLLADCHDLFKQPQEAAENRFACLSIAAEGKALEKKHEIMEKLAESFIKINEPARAAYMVSWCKAALGLTTLPAKHRIVLQEASRTIPFELMEEIMTKTSGHSIADMAAIVARAPEPTDRPEPKEVKPANPSTLVAAPPKTVTVSSEFQVGAGETAKMADSPSGVTFDAESGALEWTPTPFSNHKSAKILFLVTGADGTEKTVVHLMERD